MSTHSENWALIPSDPAVFNDMIEQYGAKDTQAVDLFSLDLLDEYKDNTNVHGLIYIFPYEEDVLPANFEQKDPLASDIVFTSQVVTNSCATLALLAALLNADINKGDLLNSFLQFTQDFSAVAVVKKFVQFITRTPAKYEAIDVANYHYITYIYKIGFVWELDGLKRQPVRLQQCTHQEWITAVKPIVQQRMQDQMDVSLMAIIKDDYRAKLSQKNAHDSFLQLTNNASMQQLATSTLSRRKRTFFDIISEAHTQYHDAMKDIWNSLYSRNFPSAEAKMNAFAIEVESFNRQVDQVTAERKRAKAESTRQKFDYFPFLQAFLNSSFQYKLLHDKSKPAKQKSAKKKVSKIPAKDSTSMKRRPARKTAKKK